MLFLLVLLSSVWIENFDDFNFNYAPVNNRSKTVQDISDGVPSSWSNHSNYRKLRDLKNPNTHRFTYQGFGIPLKYEQKYTVPVKSPSDLMDYQVSLKCCPSMYSTDQGCVCKDY